MALGRAGGHVQCRARGGGGIARARSRLASSGCQGKISNQLDIGLTATYLDDRAFFGDGVDAYALVNLYSNYKVNDSVTLNLRVENILDEDYEFARDSGDIYPGRGRGLFAGCTIQW